MGGEVPRDAAVGPGAHSLTDRRQYDQISVIAKAYRVSWLSPICQAKAIGDGSEISQSIENAAVTAMKCAMFTPSANYPSISVLDRLGRPLNSCIVMLANTAGGIIK